MQTDLLFQPAKLGNKDLQYRIAYAPLTRSRGLDNLAQPSASTYYGERARPGLLLFTEGVHVSEEAQGFACVPGIETDAQIAAWQAVTKAVHDKGGVFFMQLYHAGRASHTEYNPEGRPPPAPSALRLEEGQVFAPKQGKWLPYSEPREMTRADMDTVVADFVRSAENAIRAGFDGVEIHAANGYLLDQFLKQSTNIRTDEYGGSIENRCRFVIEVLEAVAAAVGGARVGMRISPYSWVFQACREPSVADTIELHAHLLRSIQRLGLAYVHIVTARADGATDASEVNLEAQSLAPFRAAFTGPIVAAGGFQCESARAELRSGNADVIAFGRWWLANPDFPERLRDKLPMNKYDRSTFYSHDQVTGYIDYPFFKDIPEGTPTELHHSGVTVYVEATA